MRKPVCVFLCFFLLRCLSVAADTIGFRGGLFIDSPDILAKERDFFLAPQIEYEKSFGRFDVYLGGQYALHLLKFSPQFFFAEEKFAAHLPLGPRSEFQVRLHNENELRFNPSGGSGGRVQPELAWGLSLPLGDISLALGAPLFYPTGTGGDLRFGLAGTAAYVTPFWIGVRAGATFIAAPAPVFDGMEFGVNYTGDQYFGELTFKAQDSFGYFSLNVDFSYFFDFFIIKAGIELGNLSNMDAITLAPALGIKYRL
ncbi:hypothetical protein LQZ21_04750 [Treponema sp. TIM-1]|uniref:hypothetical protein n=1 Tax=Treponema sp. TIM-1 TaxID=2898417 RepID=UPI00397F2E7E